MRVIGHVALVLHAHLPYVRHPEHERPLEERWLHEAIWESYLPVLDLLDRLEREGVRVALTVSISPSLAAMLADGLLRSRFAFHLARLSRLADSLAEGAGIDRAALEGAGCIGPALAFYRRRLAEARAAWERIGGDVLGALVAHRDRGNLELITTAATHAYLPGLLTAPASIRAQLRIGLRAFTRLTDARPLGFWLPECAYDPRLGGDLASAGVRYAVLDAHGLELARPRPPFGIAAPVLSKDGVAFFARDPDSARDVWSRAAGYPGDPVYREFYRDVGFDLPEDALLGEVGPQGSRVSTGLKLHRITGKGPHKEPYDPEAAAARARQHARHFVAQREAMLQLRRKRARARTAPVLAVSALISLTKQWLHNVVRVK